jgi:hypothetical protein
MNNEIDTGYRRNVKDNNWVAWCTVNGKRVATEFCDSEAECRAWCALQRVQQKRNLSTL